MGDKMFRPHQVGMNNITQGKQGNIHYPSLIVNEGAVKKQTVIKIGSPKHYNQENRIRDDFNGYY